MAVNPYILVGIALGALAIVVTITLVVLLWRRGKCPCNKRNDKNNNSSGIPPSVASVESKGQRRSESRNKQPVDGGAHGFVPALRGPNGDVETGRDTQDDRMTTISETSRKSKIKQRESKVQRPTSTLSVLEELGKLICKEKLLHLSLLTNANEDASRKSRLFFGDNLQLEGCRQDIINKTSDLLRFKVKEKETGIQTLIKECDGRYAQVMASLAKIGAPNEEILVQKELFVSEILQYILTFISDRFPRFRGHVEGIGSYFSGYSANATPDYDYAYILDAFDLDEPTDITMELVDARQSRYDLIVVNPELYQDWSDCIVQGNHLDGGLLLKKFQEVLFRAVQNVIPPSDATHGGFLSPYFSGLRSHNKTVSVQYLWRGESLRIDLIPCVSSSRKTHDEIFNKLGSDFQKDMENTSSVGGLFEPEAPSVIKLIVGPKWQLNDGLLRRQILRLFDSYPELAKAKKTIALIRQHLLLIRAPDLQKCYAEIIQRFSDAIRDSHSKVIVRYLQTLAESKDWEMFMLLARAAIESHQGVRETVSDMTSKHSDFHKDLSHSSTLFFQDSRKSLIKVASVLLVDILIAIYLENMEAFHSNDSNLKERDIIRLLLKRFGSALEDNVPIRSPVIEISNPPVILKYSRSTKPEDLDRAYVTMVRSVIRNLDECT